MERKHSGMNTGWIRPHTISHRLLASKILHSPTTWPEAGYVIRLCIRNAIIVATAFIILILDFCIISTQLPHNFLLAFVSLCTRCTVLWLSCHALDHHCSHLCITVGLWEAFVGYGCTEVVPPPPPPPPPPSKLKYDPCLSPSRKIPLTAFYCDAKRNGILRGKTKQNYIRDCGWDFCC